MPNAPVAWSTSPQTQPPSTRTVPAAGSTGGAPQAAKVDDEGVVPDPETAAMVTRRRGWRAAARVAGVRHAGHHVGDVGAPNDRERVSINCAVVHGPRRVILRIGSE